MGTTATTSTRIFFKEALSNFAIDIDRTTLLQALAEKIALEYSQSKKVNLNFICTHNSRRSQLAQIWSFFAIDYFQLNNISAFSGGTEATAFHRNTVATLQQAGFTFEVVGFSHQNPTYAISFEKGKNPIIAFSKTFDNPSNSKPFIAITTCNDADKNCPLILDALHRFHLPFTDPKIADGLENESEEYLKINKQIAAEIGFVFTQITKLLKD